MNILKFIRFFQSNHVGSFSISNRISYTFFCGRHLDKGLKSEFLKYKNIVFLIPGYTPPWKKIYPIVLITFN